MANLWIRAGSCSASFSGSEERYFRTISTSQVLVHLGSGGLQLNKPFMNLDTVSCWPTRTPSISEWVIEMADRIVLRVWYPTQTWPGSTPNSWCILFKSYSAACPLMTASPMKERWDWLVLSLLGAHSCWWTLCWAWVWHDVRDIVHDIRQSFFTWGSSVIICSACLLSLFLLFLLLSKKIPFHFSRHTSIRWSPKCPNSLQFNEAMLLSLDDYTLQTSNVRVTLWNFSHMKTSPFHHHCLILEKSVLVKNHSFLLV